MRFKYSLFLLTLVKTGIAEIGAVLCCLGWPSVPMGGEEIKIVNKSRLHSVSAISYGNSMHD